MRDFDLFLKEHNRNVRPENQNVRQIDVQWRTEQHPEEAAYTGAHSLSTSDTEKVNS